MGQRFSPDLKFFLGGIFIDIKVPINDPPPILPAVLTSQLAKPVAECEGSLVRFRGRQRTHLRAWPGFALLFLGGSPRAATLSGEASKHPGLQASL